ncbi:MAG TPA: hypothetical protein VJ440_08975 [Candidatus Brocadiaceae bacterium]|nr:hypothetical protein [Candidatus Brocadiaceae bacterium]
MTFQGKKWISSKGDKRLVDETIVIGILRKNLYDFDVYKNTILKIFRF